MRKEGLKEGMTKSLYQEENERPERRSQAASSDGLERRLEPEHRPGQPDWDPFFQEGRGKKFREARKKARAADCQVQARKEQGLKEGYPELPQQQQTLGSYKWRLMKEREKEMMEDERRIMLERKQLQEERAAFLAEKEEFLKRREASLPRGVQLRSVRPERRQEERRRTRRDEEEDASLKEGKFKKKAIKKEDTPEEEEPEPEKKQQEEEEEESEETEESEESQEEQKQKKREEEKNKKKTNKAQPMEIDEKDL